MSFIKELILSISLINLLDIGLIAFLFYFVALWFKGTRSFQILITLIGTGIFYFLATKMGLILTSILFQYVWAAIIIVLVIVFQPEIRQMLDRASPIRHWRNRQYQSPDSGVVEEIVIAVTELARQRTGALIVFQRLDTLDHLIVKGKDLDSALSADLLQAIFQKNSPLHDGAALIYRSRIKAAACILPLSRDEDLSAKYGTRHRAALGICERTDAICIVVSEERGEVTIVEGSEIAHFRQRSEFRTAIEKGLSNHKSENGPPSRGLGAIILSNWRLKLLSLATSIVLWFLIVGPQHSEIGISVPIQYTNLPASMEIIGPWMDRIDVRVRGSAQGLENLPPGVVRAVVDLGKVVPGVNFFRMTPDHIQVPPGITIAQIRPSDLQLNVETASVKVFKIVPTIVGALPENTKIVVSPTEAKIRASLGDLRRVTSVTTDPVNISELALKQRLKVPVTVKPEGLRIDSLDPIQVNVIFETEKP
ncbi:MAG: diadenylate cyclase CdaA [Deltaproteobacteria bacterium]|nr:diadenylate cyclase CdaA [Deltaproteobacteria bacterium]